MEKGFPQSSENYDLVENLDSHHIWWRKCYGFFGNRTGKNAGAFEDAVVPDKKEKSPDFSSNLDQP